MAHPNWLGIGTLTSAALSAIAAYLAIRQNIIQRRIANKVQLITKTLKIQIEKNIIGNIFTFDNSNNKLDHFLSIHNVGLGTALDFEYEWKFDYEKNLTLNHISKIETNYDFGEKEFVAALTAEDFTYQHDKDQNGIYIRVMGNQTSKYYHQKTIYSEVDYILPWSVNREMTFLEIPILIIKSLIHQAIEQYASGKNIFNSIEGPTLIIKYKDITGLREEILLGSSFQIEQTVSEHNNFKADFSLTFSHRLTWTGLALQRIRKRYAEWKKGLL